MWFVIFVFGTASLWAARNREQAHLDHLLSLKEGGSGGSVEFHNFQDELSKSFESDHFEFFYDTLGMHAINGADLDNNGSPDYLEVMASAFETSWSYYFVKNSYPLPRWLGNKYPIFVRNLEDGYYGYMSRYGGEGDHPSTPEIETTSSRSYIVMRNRYDASFGNQNEAIEVTAGHEFFHAIQAAYSLDLDLWFLEGSATMMESQVFPHWQDNYQYLFAWFEYSDFSLDFPDSRMDQLVDRVYGSWVVFEFLETNFDGIISQMIQDARTEDDAFSLLEATLLQKGTTILDTYYGLIQSFFEIDYPNSNEGYLTPMAWSDMDGFDFEGVLAEDLLINGVWDSEEQGDGIWRGHSVDFFELLPEQRIEINWDDSQQFFASYFDRENELWERFESPFLENNSKSTQILALVNWESNTVNASYSIDVTQIPRDKLADQLEVDKVGQQLIVRLKENQTNQSRNVLFEMINAEGQVVKASDKNANSIPQLLSSSKPYSIDLSGLLNGVYFILIQDADSYEEAIHPFLIVD